MNPKTFPMLLMIIDVCASAVCFANGDYRRGIYWIAAAVLTGSVTF